MGEDVVAIDLNPMTWLGDLAAEAIADVWTAAMVSIWSAGLWLLGLAFRVIGALTTPDVSETGPMGAVLPTTLWLGASVAVVMMFVQLTLALVRRDGRSLGRVVLGVLQFGLVWVGYLGAAGGFILAAAELARGILTAMLDVDSLAAVDPANSWPRDVVDATAATVLGLSSLLLVIPAAFFYVIIALVREAALIILIATAPISAGGVLSDSTRVWFWKSLRWFFASLLITPTAALMLGIGVKLSAGVVAGAGDDTAQAAGTAVVGAVMVAIGAVCPMVLFRLLAFVDPGTASGSALRQSWSDAGGLQGLAVGFGMGGRVRIHGLDHQGPAGAPHPHVQHGSVRPAPGLDAVAEPLGPVGQEIRGRASGQQARRPTEQVVQDPVGGHDRRLVRRQHDEADRGIVEARAIRVVRRRVWTHALVHSDTSLSTP